MFLERHRAQVEGAVAAVEQEPVAVEFLHGDGIHALGIREDRDTHMAALPFPAVVDVALAFVLIPDIEGIAHNGVGQCLAELHRFQGAGIRYPARTVIDEPLFALRYEPGDVPEHISEQSAVADVVPRIPFILRRSEGRDRRLQIIEILCGGDFLPRGAIEICRQRDGLVQGADAVVIALPFFPVQTRLSEQPVHLLSIASAPERQHGAEGGIGLTVGFALRNDAVPQGCELLALPGFHCPHLHGGVVQIAAGSRDGADRFFRLEHVFFQHGHRASDRSSIPLPLIAFPVTVTKRFVYPATYTSRPMPRLLM